jgi:two-component system sensor histidine kinase CreC
MKIGLRILLGYFLIVGLAAWFLLGVFVQQVKPGVRSTLEDTLVDSAHVLVSLVQDDVKAGRIAESPVLARIRAAGGAKPDAQIDGWRKRSLNMRVYITDANGRVIFDSTGRDLGADYSRWNDVYLTLRGRYGARSSRTRADDDNSGVMYVAAPIRDGSRIIGVLTVGKPLSTVAPFVARSQRVILERGALLLLLSLLIGIAFTWWLARNLGRLMDYIRAAEAGQKVALPPLGDNEFGTLGRALDDMRNQLEGKEYAEELMHTLAHELKSPIAAIQGSAELLREDMPLEERRRFLANILAQNARQRDLIDRLLALVRVEKQQQLDKRERIAVAELVAAVAGDAEPSLRSRAITLQENVDDSVVEGDPLLLRQALGNLLDNAQQFTPPGGTVRLDAGRAGDAVLFVVEDGGPGVPDYARDRVFERFYSLPRPDAPRSSGLGLPFVREVAALHGGSASLENAAGGGARASLRLPAV